MWARLLGTQGWCMLKLHRMKVQNNPFRSHLRLWRHHSHGRCLDFWIFWRGLDRMSWRNFWGGSKMWINTLYTCMYIIDISIHTSIYICAYTSLHILIRIISKHRIWNEGWNLPRCETWIFEKSRKKSTFPNGSRCHPEALAFPKWGHIG